MSVTETGIRGSRGGELNQRRIVLLADSAGLAAVVKHLLDPADRLSRIGSPHELAESRLLDSADVVVLDVAAEDRAGAISQVRRRYLGPLVVLVARGDDTHRLHLDSAVTLLARPFSTEELAIALATPGHSRGSRPSGLWTMNSPARGDWRHSSTVGPAAGSGRVEAERNLPGRAPFGVPREGPAAAGIGALAGPDAAPVGPGASGDSPATEARRAASMARGIDVKAAARKAPVRRVPATRPRQLGPFERGQRLLVNLTHGWKGRRRVLVAGLSALALAAFTVAFALAAQNRCGPGCDGLGITGTSRAPSILIGPSGAPTTAASRRTPRSTAVQATTRPNDHHAGVGGRSDSLLGSTITARQSSRAPTTTQAPIGGTAPAPTTTQRSTTTSTTGPTTTQTTGPTTTIDTTPPPGP